MILRNTSSRPRLLTLLLCLIVGLFAIGLLLGPSPAHAQGDDKAASSGDAKQPESRSAGKIFVHIIKSSGWVFGPIMLLMSVLMVALIVLLGMEMRYSNAVPPGFVEDFSDTVNKRQFKAAYDMAREDSSFLGVVLTSSMSRLQYGIEDAREAALNAVASVKASKEQLVTYLGTIGTVGPMVGLIGTVFGMILAFMRLSDGTGLDPEVLAKDISVALVTTLLGVAVAVPAIFCHALFRNRLISLATDASNIADDLLTQMYHNSRKPAGGQPAPSSSNPGTSSGNRESK